MDYDVFDLGPLALTGGMTVPDAKLAYKTYGSSTRTRATPSSTRPGTRGGTGTTSG